MLLELAGYMRLLRLLEYMGSYVVRSGISECDAQERDLT